MINPEEVKHSQAFSLLKVIYNQNDFSIGIGKTVGNNYLQVAMRWNGTDDGVGFPRAFKHPLWFTLPHTLTKSVLVGILENARLTIIEKNEIKSILRIVENVEN